MRGGDAVQFHGLHAADAGPLGVKDRQAVAVAQIVVVAHHALAEDAPELAAETAPEEIVRHEVDGRVEDDEEVAGLVERVQREALEDLRVLLERPDDARDERRSLAEEEDDDDADEHDGGVVALALHRVDLLASAP